MERGVIIHSDLSFVALCALQGERSGECDVHLTALCRTMVGLH